MKSPNLFLTLVGAVAMTFGLSNSSVQAQCPADVNHDQQVNATDLASVLSAWGTNGSATGTDINNDGLVNGSDLTILFSGWGPCPGPAWATVLEWAPDAAVVTDATLRNAITASGLPWRVRDNGTQIEMVLVPGGTFTMGCTASDEYACFSSENPTHSVTITNAFYMGRYEVTQAQWLAKMGSNPSIFQPPTYTADTSRPVETVSWNTIQGFLTATGMQLPTEAQWEYACRAGTTTAFHGFTKCLSGTNDDTLVGNIAWYFTNFGGKTHAVGGKAANGLGLHDMSGNVWEWCSDWYGAYSAGAQTNPTGPATGTNRVLRGGSWNDYTYIVRSSNRNGGTPVYFSSRYDGFRVARIP